VNILKNFIVIYHATASAIEQMKDSGPEDMQKGMELWMAWANKIGTGLVEMGTPLGGGQKITESGSSPSDRGVVGYSILQAEDMEGAIALLEGHPHLGWAAGCEIEVHESLPMPQ
jgi:hypothetical protein